LNAFSEALNLAWRECWYWCKRSRAGKCRDLSWKTAFYRAFYLASYRATNIRLAVLLTFRL